MFRMTLWWWLKFVVVSVIEMADPRNDNEDEFFALSP